MGAVGFVQCVFEGCDLPRIPSSKLANDFTDSPVPNLLGDSEGHIAANTDGTTKHPMCEKTCLQDPGRRVRRCGDVPGG